MAKKASQDSPEISREFISKLTHGTRSPFNGLMGFSELLSANFYKLGEDEKRDYVFHINMLSKKALLSLDQFILWLKLREGLVMPGNVPCSVNEAVTLALNRVGEQLQQKKCSVDNALEDELAVTIMADTFLIGQLFSFLLDFCTHYSEEKNEIAIHFTGRENHRKVTITAELNDTGLEIVNSDLKNTKLLGATQNSNDYRNLGLWLCYRLADLQKTELHHELSGKRSCKFLVKL
jgi:K+-sensing histidine kinase KdpD